MNSTVSRLDELTKNLNEGKGTAGQLLHDTKLYDTMNSAANEIKELIADIRKDPKKYLNVQGQHFLRGVAICHGMMAAAGTVVVAFVLGAITGAAVALLMAPAIGRRDPPDAGGEGARRAREGRRSGAARGASSGTASAKR